jgi:hypothetical protein
MNARKTITLAGALLALAAPAANASFDKDAPVKAQHAKKGHHPSGRTGKTSGGNVVVMIIAPPLPAGTQLQPPSDPLLECEGTGADCTAAQLCTVWGINCPAPADQANDTAAEPETART